MSVPYQKTIYIERESENARKDYLKVSNYNLKIAMYNLSSSAFMLWIYFTSNSNGYSFDLYPVDFTNTTKLSRSTYERAFNELLLKGYLVGSTKKANTYLFKEVSESEKILKPDTIKSFDKDDFNKVKEELF